VPTYNGENYLIDMFNSLFSQSFQDFEIIVSDDKSTDNTINLLENIKDPRLKIFQNDENLGYGKNIQGLWKKATANIIFLMGQDDILLKDALLRTYNAFFLDENIGAVTRPFYMFDNDIYTPVRAIRPYDVSKDSVISIFDGEKVFNKIFESVGQLSGLAFRKEFINIDFHEDTFPAHIYPFASIAKKHKVVFLKDYTVAARIISSQTRFKPSIYDISPTYTWVRMFETVFGENDYKVLRKIGIKQISKNFVGLFQIKNYSTVRNLFKEILLLVKYWPFNLIDPRFWFYAFVVIATPRKLLIKLVDFYKNNLLSKSLRDIKVKL
jgi:glycosyltransferase involved in cell wall biosynthesis